MSGPPNGEGGPPERPAPHLDPAAAKPLKSDVLIVPDPLAVARQLIARGVPVFAAPPALDDDGKWDSTGGHGGCGYRLPPQWEKTWPTENWLDPSARGFEHKAWRPGYALCAVMGRGLDALDCDPRNGGEASRAALVEAGVLPTLYARATTPSGGTHEFVASMGVGSRDGFRPGLDLKGGKPDGSSRGFVFLAPTAKVSKASGEIGTYAWTDVRLDELDPDDESGKALGEIVRPVKPQPPKALVSTPARAVKGDPRLTAYAQRAWQGEVARLTAMANSATPYGTGYVGSPWNATTFDVACNLLEIANAEWSPYGVEQAYAAVVQYAPTDAGFTSEDVNARWQSAVKTVGDKPRALPAERVSAAEVAAWDIPGEAAEKQADFWDERPVLAHVRDFAYARMCAPLAVLGVVLARVVAATPPQVVLPATIGSYASLNIFVGLVGDSGSGKGAAEAAAKDAVLLDPVEVATVGSGEGIGHLYAHREKGQVVRDRWSVLFTVPEVDTLTALGDRRGATLLPQLRSAWMGEQLGFAYADKNKALPIPEHTYRMGLVAGIQPGRAAGLLEDGDGGTPQRFVWLPATDPRIPERSAEPQPLRVHSQVWPSPDRGLFALTVPEVAQKAMRTARLARGRGEGDPLDGHALLCRLKVAAALTLLDGRRVVTDDDWRLAGVVMEVSARTRRGVQRHLAAQASKANQARARFEGERAVIASETVEDAAVQRVARRLTTHLQEHGESARSDARKRLTSRDRPHFDEAVERLVAAGQVEVLTTPHGERLSLVGASS